jgi:hypothetical protein
MCTGCEGNLTSNTRHLLSVAEDWTYLSQGLNDTIFTSFWSVFSVLTWLRLRKSYKRSWSCVAYTIKDCASSHDDVPKKESQKIESFKTRKFGLELSFQIWKLPCLLRKSCHVTRWWLALACRRDLNPKFGAPRGYYQSRYQRTNSLCIVLFRTQYQRP